METGGLAVALLWIAKEVVAQIAKTRRARASLTVDERRLLSVDEQQFRAELLHELAAVKLELAKCQEQHSEAVVARLALGQQLAQTQHLLERVRAAAIAGGIVLEPEVMP